MTLPNFLIIGSQKASTTSLYHLLRHHPDIYMSHTKEINYFFYDDHYTQGESFYRAYFQAADTEKRRGEASPGYICHPEAPARIHALLPQAKLILTVRHPVDRAYSQYWDNRRKLSETGSFAAAYRHHFHKTYQPGQIGYFSRGFYITYIQNYLQHFSRHQLLIIVLDDLKRDPTAVYRRILRFLDVDTDYQPPNMGQRYNTPTIWNNPLYQLLFHYPTFNRLLPFRLRRRLTFGRARPFKYPPMDADLRTQLLADYAAANQRLADFLGRPLDHWSR